MCPKKKSDHVQVHRLELQETERDQLQLLIGSEAAKNASSTFENITKPFFGSGDSGIMLTYITTFLLDELILPDDSIVDMAIDTKTGEYIFKNLWSVFPSLSHAAPAEVAWNALTESQKKNAKPIMMALSRTLKVTKYVTGTYLGAKAGADIINAFIPG